MRLLFLACFPDSENLKTPAEMLDWLCVFDEEGNLRLAEFMTWVQEEVFTV